MLSFANPGQRRKDEDFPERAEDGPRNALPMVLTISADSSSSLDGKEWLSGERLDRKGARRLAHAALNFRPER